MYLPLDGLFANKGSYYYIPKTSSAEQFKNDTLLHLNTIPYGHKFLTGSNSFGFTFSEGANYHVELPYKPTSLDIKIKSELFYKGITSRREYIELIQYFSKNPHEVYKYFFTRLYAEIKIGNNKYNIPVDLRIGRYIYSFSKNKTYKSFKDYENDMFNVFLNFIFKIMDFEEDNTEVNIVDSIQTNNTIDTYLSYDSRVEFFSRAFLNGSHGLSGFVGTSSFYNHIYDTTAGNYSLNFNKQYTYYSLVPYNNSKSINIWAYIILLSYIYDNVNNKHIISIYDNESDLYLLPTYPQGLKFYSAFSTISLIASIVIELRDIINKDINDEYSILVMSSEF